MDGKWLTGDGDGWIEVRRKGKGLSGVVAGSPNDDPDEDRFDEKNPDPKLRKRLLKGVELFSDFEYEGDGRWSGGTIYDPNSGRTYSCTVTLEDENTLKVRGYIGVSLFGRTDVWTRVQD